MKASLEIANYLKEKRVAAGLSQKDVANILGYTTAQFVSNWERAIILPPAETLSIIMKIYKIPEEEFLQQLMSYSENFWRETLSVKKSLRSKKSI